MTTTQSTPSPKAEIRQRYLAGIIAKGSHSRETTPVRGKYIECISHAYNRYIVLSHAQAITYAYSTHHSIRNVD